MNIGRKDVECLFPLNVLIPLQKVVSHPISVLEHILKLCESKCSKVKRQLRKRLAEKAKDGTLKANGEPKPAPKKRGRWDQTNDTPVQKKIFGASATSTSWDNADVTPAAIRWDETRVL